jgi:hypothetical protein
MIWADDGVATEVEAMGPFISIVMLVCSAAGFWMGYEMFVLDNNIALSVLLIALGVGAIAFAAYMLKISLFSSYCDLHFNRKTGKIYSRENNLSLQMDWKHVRPFAARGIGPVQLGGPPVMSLILAEFHPTQPNILKARMIVAGMLPNRHGCQEVWELIRRYMDESPDTLPELEVVPGGRNWTSALLEFGPLANHIKSVSELIADFRDNNWWPIITPVNVLWWIVAWPFPLSTTLYARYRPKAKLPAEWTAQEMPPHGSENPYRITSRDAAEAAGRRKAAWVIGLTSGICVLLGVSLTAYVIFTFTHTSRHA